MNAPVAAHDLNRFDFCPMPPIPMLFSGVSHTTRQPVRQLGIFALVLSLFLVLRAPQATAQRAQGIQSQLAADGMPGVRGGGTQGIRVRLVRDDDAVGGTVRVVLEARTEDLVANTFGSATIDIAYDPRDLSFAGGDRTASVLRYLDSPYTFGASEPVSGVLRFTASSQIGGLDGVEIDSDYEPLYAYNFTILTNFDETDFPIDCGSLSVGYHDDVDDADGNGVILDNSTGAIPMLSVQPLALRTLNLTADPGWRTLSGLSGMRVEDLFGQLSTRGFPGADSPTGFPNVWRWDEASGWFSAASQVEALPSTDGVAFLALPADRSASVRVGGAFADYAYREGSPASCSAFPLAFDVTYTSDGSTGFEPGWNLEGNPTAGTLDWDAQGWVRTGLTNTIYIYDAVSDQYLTWNGTTGTLGDGLIAPLQGFWVKATGSPAPALVAPEAALTSGGTFYGRSAGLATTGGGALDAQSIRAPLKPQAVGQLARVRSDTLLSGRGAVLALRIEGEVQGSEQWAAAYLSFQPGGEAGLDRFDAEALAGLGDTSLDLYTLLDDDSGEGATALEIDARPQASLAGGDDGPLAIPLAVDAMVGDEAVGGKFTLTLLEASRLPPGVRPVLVDTETGATVDLLGGQEYVFEVAAPEGITKPDPARVAASASSSPSSVASVASANATRPSEALAGSLTTEAASDADLSHMRAPVARRGDIESARFVVRFEAAQDIAAADAARSGADADKDGDVVAVRGEASLPEAFALESVYPNPFADRATVRYALPESADVRIVAYDLLGRRVAVLADTAKPAGYHTASWDASRLPSGVYILRLVAGPHTFAERITVMH